VKNWERALVEQGTSLRDALVKIDAAGTQLAVIVDQHRKLMGTLSDGDVRRGLIKGLSLSDKVEQAMCSTPRSVAAGESRETVRSLLKRLGLHQVPVVLADRTVVGLEIVDDFFVPPVRDNWVVVMAGGLGTRLSELTRSVPKPMLSVGNRPMLETILRSYVDQGFRKFYLAVNYKAELIERHFGDGGELGAEIRYLRESKRMGTAGALSLLPSRPDAPVLVTNGDVLVKLDHGEMLSGHIEAGAAATMAVREYEYQIPFGVIQEENGRLRQIEEKPIHRTLVCAGMYALSPEALDMVPSDTYLDMPTLFNSLIDSGLHARCHPINGYWMDVGRMSDYEKANSEFYEVFK
jgi:dTDP-glucose pyrophosphorylase